jgi:transposase-like protein
MEKKNIVLRKSYTAMFKLEVVDFAKEKGNREAARKFNVGETSVREWRKEEAAVKCLQMKIFLVLSDLIVLFAISK